ncbi:MAG: helix-turn-helix transcriptional regulator [Muribaculaceae bacterium]|nr:helix-turn-helix transcriptional regulator [Muribaculaceae bacterium]
MEITVKVNYKNDNLQQRRQAAGLSQSQLAKLAGVGVRVYQNYEQGVRDISKAQLSTLLRICKALNCKLSDIVTDQETAELLKEYEG